MVLNGRNTNCNSTSLFTSFFCFNIILNREKTVTGAAAAEDGTRLDPYNRVSVFIKRAVASTTYAVYVDNVLKATTATNSNVDAASALEGTAEIAEELRADAVTKGNTNVGIVGSTVYFDVPVGAVVTVTDQFGGAAMRIIQDKIQEFSDLPPTERVGRLVKVMGDAQEDGDATSHPHISYDDVTSSSFCPIRLCGYAAWTRGNHTRLPALRRPQPTSAVLCLCMFPALNNTT